MLIPYRKGDKWGYCDKNKKTIIKCKYEAAAFFFYQLGKVKQNGKWGLIDARGKLFVPCNYDIVYGSDKEARIVVCVGGDKNGHGGKWGYVKRYKGKDISLKYDLVRECFVQGLLGVKKNGKWGAINTNGKEVIPVKYQIESSKEHIFPDLAYPELTSLSIGEKVNPPASYLKLRFNKGTAKVGLNGKWGYINRYGNTIIPIQYDYISDFHNNIACVIQNGEHGRKVGFINRENELIIPLEYDFDSYHYTESNFREGLVQVKQNGKWGYIDTKNNMEIPLQFSQAKPFHEGLAAVSMDHNSITPKWFFINKKGKKVFDISSEYEFIDLTFQSGFIRAKYKNQQLFINKKGKPIGKRLYHKIFPFKGDFAKVVIQNQDTSKMGFINQDGKEVIPPIYNFENDKWINQLLRVGIQDKYGIINTKNEILVPLDYEDVRVPSSFDKLKTGGLITVKKNGKWGFVNLKGDVKIPFKYEYAYLLYNGFIHVKYNGKWGIIDIEGTEYFEDEESVIKSD